MSRTGCRGGRGAEREPGRLVENVGLQPPPARTNLRKATTQQKDTRGSKSRLKDSWNVAPGIANGRRHHVCNRGQTTHDGAERGSSTSLNHAARSGIGLSLQIQTDSGSAFQRSPASRATSQIQQRGSTNAHALEHDTATNFKHNEPKRAQHEAHSANQSRNAHGSTQWQRNKTRHHDRDHISAT